LIARKQLQKIRPSSNTLRRDKKLLNASERIKNSFSYRFMTDQQNVDTRASAFTFVMPTTERFASEAERTIHLNAKNARRREQYKRLAQLTETFSEFMPQLLQKLIGRRKKKAPLSYRKMRGVVDAAY
jgi:hypothetical protein